MADHGAERISTSGDPDLVLGLALSIEQYAELFPCPCEARCLCDEVGDE